MEVNTCARTHRACMQRVSISIGVAALLSAHAHACSVYVLVVDFLQARRSANQQVVALSPPGLKMPTTLC